MKTLKIKLEIYLDENIIDIHTNINLLNIQKPLKYLLLNIHGIENINIYKYSINIEKGKLFCWDCIIPQTTNILFYMTTKTYLNSKYGYSDTTDYTKNNNHQ